MTELLQADNISDLKGREQNVLVRLLVASIKKAAGQRICPKSKGDPEAKITKVPSLPTSFTNDSLLFLHQSNIEKDLEGITDQFVDKLPELLESFKADHKKIEELVVIPQYINLDAYHVQRRSAVRSSLLILFFRIGSFALFP